MRRNPISAAKRIEQIVKLEHSENQDGWRKAMGNRYNEWYERGRDKALNLELEIAIEIARRMSRAAFYSEGRGYWKDNLGTALWTLGERESRTERLEEAVAAYREALKERTRERVPLDWATTQNNLGNALSRLGEREGGTAGWKKRWRPIARR